ncbi:MAG TPA: hypothetical protein VEA99_11740 [Gemmatimonadaceae bacterium]|nr:hypothetical protein [Gemmatimonadaceae bacterium]
MADDDIPPITVDDPDAPLPPPPAPPRRRRKWPWLVLLSVILVPAAMFAIWAAIALTYSFSEGTRTGHVLKLSSKGWVCKTWEGELAMSNVPGSMPEKWEFTVRDDSVARRIQDLQGQPVQLTYEEHKGVPTACFGDTRYFVTEVRPVGGTAAPPASPGQPAPAPPRP